MTMFIVTFFISLGGIFYDSQFKKEEVTTEAGPNGQEGYQLHSEGQPTYGAAN
eukprot:CAMPEP_0194046958 /NCGR_PEP_ID=MMETSP0009_2-20130614/23149_1 /TAXON_ID=210454 /ORGANISM="Grammatophora oceanica, Strain CCMP 410" /LENGTH=52 /DNA_ID=CAMNT_0038692445 /DNA_START=256 /DNA_END=414 /DNA_ORIENTATION=+